MLLQGGLTVGHRAHNPKIGGSIPPPARNYCNGFFFIMFDSQHQSKKTRIIPSFDFIVLGFCLSKAMFNFLVRAVFPMDTCSSIIGEIAFL